MPQEIATRSLAALSVILALAGGAAVAGDAAFGGPTFSSTIGFDIAVSPDKKTFTAAFSGLEAILDVKTAAVAPIVTRVFSFSIPLSGTDPGQEIPFFVQGAAISEKGANTQLVFSVNDQSMVAYLPAGGSSKESYLQQFNYKATDAAEAKITVFLVASRDSKSGAGAYVNVSTIDTDITKHKR